MARAQGKAVSFTKSDVNAGMVYLDELKVAELEGAPGEDWRSVKAKYVCLVFVQDAREADLAPFTF